MLDWITQRGVTPIGLDIGSSSIKMVQFSTGGALSVIASGQYALPDDLTPRDEQYRAVVIEGIGKLLESSPFRGRQVVATVPNRMLQFKNIRLPQMPPADQAEAVQWEAVERFQLEDKQAVVQYLNAGEVRHGQDTKDEVILMAAMQQSIDDHTHMLVDAGLQLTALEPMPIAVARSFARLLRREADRNEVRVCVEIGRSGSNVIILRGSRVMFFKPVEIGGTQINNAVAEHLDLSVADATELRSKLAAAGDDEQCDTEQLFGSTRRENVRRAVFEAVRPIIGDLANEVGLCLRYYSVTFRGQRPNQVLLTGGESHDPTFQTLMGEQLEADVQMFDPLDGIDLSSDQVAIERRGRRTEWTVATGLALRPAASAAARLRGAA